MTETVITPGTKNDLQNKEGLPRAIIYTRVSTGEQAEHGTSLTEQLLACRKRSAELKAEVVAVYEDSGVSGSLYQARPGIQAALRDLEGGRIR